MSGRLDGPGPASEKSLSGTADEGGFLFCPVSQYGKSFDGYILARGGVDDNPTAADEGTLTVTVGGSVSGVIDVTGDVDTITVSLTAGQIYLFSLVGTGANPVTDTLLTIFAPGGAQLVEDDDGGNGLFSLITITATMTGTYTLTAESFPNAGDPGLGGWTLSVRQQGTDSVPNTEPSTVDAVVGGSTYGFLETGGDRDVYRVTLSEGFLYTFAVAGGHDYSTPGAVGTLELDTVITVRDAAGNIVATNDDIDDVELEDLSSLTSFFAEASGTYYVEIRSFNDPGGYVLDISQTDLSTLNPLDAIDWGGVNNAVNNDDTLLIYFATAGQTYDGETSLGWTAYEQQRVLAAFQTYSQFADLNFAITTNAAIADFKLVTVNSDDFLGYFNPPGETNAGVGVFAIDGSGWDRTGATGGLEPGGYGWITLIHEFGHGLGMAHPHDDGGGSDIMPGVAGAFGSYGVFDLNQGVYTVMSYNDGWQLHPDADANGSPVPDTLSYGYQGTPMALDIALMQLKYGAVSHNSGNNVYILDTANVAGTFYECIWDTGGTDGIQYSGTADCTIDLTAATLDYSATGAGVLSWVDGIFGGFTIAATVVIENATGGNGNDALVGNNAANVLTGNGGNDSLLGRAGNDTLNGGAGNDRMEGGTGDDTYLVDATGDQIVELAGEGSDTVYTTVSYQLGAGLSVEILAAQDNSQTTALSLSGNELANVIFGNNGANFLDGAAGADIMTGFGGDDIYAIDNAGDLVDEANNGGNDSIFTTFSYVLGLGASVETLAARDNSLTVTMNLFGNELANVIFGNNGTNFIDGSTGADIMTGFGGDDTYAVDNAGDVVIEDAGRGNDAIFTTFSYVLGLGMSVETLASRDNSLTSAMNLFGNELDNFIFGNNGSNFIDGGQGADTMTGFGGDDSYIVDNVNDRVVENPGGGNDAIYTTFSYALAATHSIETLAAQDNSLTVALNLTGNELNNTLLGNNGANVLNGGGGADVLVGFGGADTFAFTTAAAAGNADTIADFVAGTDKIALDDAMFSGIGAPGSFTAAAFVAGSAAADADDRIVYNAATGQLFYDADGNGAGAAILLATLSGTPTLTAADFQVI